MKVSVALAAFNGERYLKEQLQSVYEQSLTVDEVIICDDCSSDNTVLVAESFIREKNLHGSWHIYKNKENLGYAGNFIRTMNLCHGKYIFLCDQDDIWFHDKVMRMVKVMDDNPGIKLLACDYEPYACTKDAPKLSREIMNRMKNDGSVRHIHLDCKTIFIGSEGCAMSIRRQFFEQIKGYWTYGWAHDEFIWKLSLCEDACYLYHRILFKRRLHSDNVSKRKMHQIEKRIQFLDMLLVSHRQTLEYANMKKLAPDILTMIRNNQESVRLRIELLKNKKWMNIIPLTLRYLKYYSCKRSILVEMLMSVRNK